jgi:NADH:ubiquinone reductase (H+-translocating)
VPRRRDGEVAGVTEARHHHVIRPLVRGFMALPRKDRERRSARLLRASVCSRHDLAEAACHHRAAALGEEPPDLFCRPLPVGPAADDRDLARHGRDGMPMAVAATRDAAGGTLLLGGGFAGAWVARLLGRRSATVVSRENFMLFTPLLPEAASGSLEPRHVVVPLRQMCPHAELVLGEIEALDEAARTVRVSTDTGPVAVRYERLVVALGSISRALPVPGLAEHGMGFKDLADAIALRNHVLRRLEGAVVAPDREWAERELTFVFVGAGYAGVEALAELELLTEDALRYYPQVQEMRRRWVLVDAAPKILPEIPSRLGDYAARELERRGVEIHVSTTLASYDGRDAVLSNATRIPTRTLVWTAGVRANPLLAQLGLPLDERGRVRVDSTLRVEGRENVWALGDCTAVPNERTSTLDPPTSQHALRQARRLARNLQGSPKPYGYRTLGQVATLGRYRGIADVLGVPLRGFPGWFVTRTYHLFQLPLLSRKLRVVTDWTVALFFRRDIAELSMLGHPRRLEPP